jgi:hypothetical protein
LENTADAMGQTSFTEMNGASFNKSILDISTTIPVIYNDEETI